MSKKKKKTQTTETGKPNIPNLAKYQIILMNCKDRGFFHALKTQNKGILNIYIQTLGNNIHWFSTGNHHLIS